MAALSVSEIAKAVEGQLQGDANRVIDGAAGLEEATDCQISFFHNMKYVDFLMRTRAGAVLIPDRATNYPLPEGKTWIRVANPQWAFAQVLSILHQDRIPHPKGIHPNAHVEPSAVIGEGTIIYPGCYIGHKVRIGPDCLIYPNVVLREETELGARVVIHPGAVLGSDGYGFVTQGGRHLKIPQVGKVVVEDDVEIGANVTVDRATTGETRIGAGTKIDNLVHIAHNVKIGRDCLIVAQVGISGSTQIGNRVTLAGQAGIVGHLTIGDDVVIAAQSGIMNDVGPGEMLFGTPGRPHKEAMKLQAIFGKLPEIYEALKQLKKKVLP